MLREGWDERFEVGHTWTVPNLWVISAWAEKVRGEGFRWICITPRAYYRIKKDLQGDEGRTIDYSINEIEGLKVCVLKEGEYDDKTDFIAASYFNVSNALMWDTQRESNDSEYNVEDVYKMKYLYYKVKEENGEEGDSNEG